MDREGKGERMGVKEVKEGGEEGKVREESREDKEKIEKMEKICFRVLESNDWLKTANLDILYFLSFYKDVDDWVKKGRFSEIKEKLDSMKSQHLSISEIEDWLRKNDEILAQIKHNQECKAFMEKITAYEKNLKNTNGSPTLKDDKTKYNTTSVGLKTGKSDYDKYVSHNFQKTGVDSSPSKLKISQSQTLNSPSKRTKDADSVIQNSRTSLSELQRKIQKLQAHLNEKVQHESNLVKENESLKVEIGRLNKVLKASKNTSKSLSLSSSKISYDMH